MPETSIEAIEHLFYSTYSSLYEYANSVLRDEKLADRIVQKVFVTAFQNFSELQKSDDPPAFLLGILKELLLEMGNRK